MKFLLKYIEKYHTRSDINEHLPVLEAYTRQCESVVECGVREPTSAYAFAFGLMGKAGNKYTLIDPYKSALIEPFLEECTEIGVNASFIQSSDIECLPIETDLLFIDSWHVYGHLKRELAHWHASVRKYIIFHDTTVDEIDGETIRMGWDANRQSLETGIPVEEIRRGLRPAIDEFLAEHPEWTSQLVLRNNNGLTVIQRVA
ncbi:MAG: class I SAM-dependent methyltransferase [Gloeobacteraceae cyanobacterium ES-bin-144]|nr:class I SAM-dependent methyltransferase [Verrucomicrobiales bacterium]